MWMMTRQLLELLSWVKLPDMELLGRGSDTPLLDKFFNAPVPILTWTADVFHYELPWPTMAHWHATRERALQRAAEAGGRALGGASDPAEVTPATPSRQQWAQRTAKAYWRGAMCGPDAFPVYGWDSLWRPMFVDEANRPDNAGLFDVAFHVVDSEALTGISAAETDALARGRYRFTAPEPPEPAFRGFKYLPNPDGVTSAWRLTSLLGTGAVVLQPTSWSAEFFQPLLTAGVHYLPVDMYSSDAARQVRWLRDHDEAAFNITVNAAHLLDTRMRREDTLCYMFRLLLSLARMQPAAFGALPDEAVAGLGYRPVPAEFYTHGIAEDPQEEPPDAFTAFVESLEGRGRRRPRPGG
jgi:hypothetical protein